MFHVLLDTAMQLYGEEGIRLPEQFAGRLMDLEGLPMHCPEHHFIVPAALLLSAHRAAGSAPETVQKDLQTALVRAKQVPGGACGNLGCCGAAVGTGLFLAIWYKTDPKSTENWAMIQRMTARGLTEIATVEGPRCCKRVTFLALKAARTFCREELGLDFGEEPKIVCKYFSKNRECRHAACPYFPRRAGLERA